MTEYHNGSQWVRVDPQFAAGQAPVDVRDLGCGSESPLRSAADTWLLYRAGGLDVSDHGVFPGAPPELSGPAIVKRYVVLQAAHPVRGRAAVVGRLGAIAPWGDELSDAETDHLARLLVATDSDDARSSAAEDEELYARYRADERLHPGR